MIGIIAACTQNGVIGVDGQLAFCYPEDMQHFKRMTTDSAVIMGRKTFESIGKPLPKRENIVITSKITSIPGIKCFANVEQAINYQKLIIRDSVKNIWFIGGASIYEEGMKYADEIHLTISSEDYENAKHAVKFPWINPTIFKVKETKLLVPENKKFPAGPKWITISKCNQEYYLLKTF